MNLKDEKEKLEIILRDIDKMRHNLLEDKKEIEKDIVEEWEGYSEILKALEEARQAGNQALNIMSYLTSSIADLNPKFEKFFKK